PGNSRSLERRWHLAQQGRSGYAAAAYWLRPVGGVHAFGNISAHGLAGRWGLCRQPAALLQHFERELRRGRNNSRDGSGRPAQLLRCEPEGPLSLPPAQRAIGAPWPGAIDSIG